MDNVLPPHVHDSMMASSRKLFNAAQDGNKDFARATIEHVIERLTFTITVWKSEDTHGTN